jgi:hypothetical protein
MPTLTLTEWMNLLSQLKTVISRYGWENVLEAVKYLEHKQ